MVVLASFCVKYFQTNKVHLAAVFILTISLFYSLAHVLVDVSLQPLVAIVTLLWVILIYTLSGPIFQRVLRSDHYQAFI